MDTRPPPPQGNPPSYAFVTRVYRRNLRPVVLSVAFLAGLWTLFSAIGFFRNAAIDNDNNSGKLKLVAIILGVLYMVITAIEALGLFAAVTQKLGAARMYAFLSGLATVIIIGVGLTRVVIHFVLKNDILTLCTNANNGRTIVYFGFWGPISRDTLSEAAARNWCNDSWKHGSWSEILAFLITSVLAGLITAIAFSFYRQLLDPLSPANAARAPSAQTRLGAYPSHYNPPYDTPAPGYGYPGYSQPSNYFPPPPGPPPQQDDPFNPPYEGKPPGYVGGDGHVGYKTDDKDDYEGPSGGRFH